MGFDFSIFIGRFHPLFVHLPIGIIIITLILEIIGRSSKNTLSYLWFFSFISALFSIFTGWQLALDSSYPENSLFWHRWLGVSVATITFLLYAITKFTDKRNNIFSSVLKIGLLVGLSIGGHIGGQLTHGNNYLLDAAPNFIKKIAGYETQEPFDLSGIHLDSIETYQHIIYPILAQKCVQCHNKKSASGNLDLTAFQAILQGGDGGEVIAPGSAENSELFKRVTLEQNNVKFMPTKGIPMSFMEVDLLKWWINKGAGITEKVSTAEMPPDIFNYILNLYNIDLSPRPWYEKEKGPALDSTSIEALASKGFRISRMSSSDHFLELGLAGDVVNESLDFSNLNENIIILDFKNAKIGKENYAKISALKNLIRLQLNGTDTKSEDLLKIKPLSRLESINLYGTQIDDKALGHLTSFPSLKRIYTWQTNVTDEGIAALLEKRPDIMVSNGIK